MTFSDFIKYRRGQLGLSLRATAARAGVDAAHLSRVESGGVQPSSVLVEKLAGVLEVPLDELQLVAGRVPSSLQRLVERDPHQVASALNDLAVLVVAEPDAHYGGPTVGGRTERAIEDGFPFEHLSEIAEVESWRKEVWRPVYHTHKWWAQRLGSVFRAAVLGCSVPRGTALMDVYASAVKLPAPVIFDPFMGSGTTIGEAHKLGCTVIGRDINPVAWRVVKTAMQPVSKPRLLKLFRDLEKDVAQELLELHRSQDSRGEPCDVLYWFWVKQLDCPSCREAVDLFKSRVFAKHAYVKKYPTVRVVCPECGDVFAADNRDKEAACHGCGSTFDLHSGPAAGAKATCGHCGHSFAMAKVARATGSPPRHRLYAKLVLRSDGEKEYLRATDEDLASFDAASARLRDLDPPLPRVRIDDGHNTRQVLNYGYTTWDQFFNDRQLLGISLLAAGISRLPTCPEREALTLLLAGVLEFNNMFASYKGEGTGAVRHMFSHHVLKPERTPIEANLWGTRKSSGSFLNLFKLRLLKAIDYKAAPFEIAVDYSGRKKAGRKLYGKSPPMGTAILDQWPEAGLPARAMYLSCGDSSRTDVPDRVVDAVVTDPPFYDNVHYSELADFFYVWHRLWFGDSCPVDEATTRNVAEVQDKDSSRFSDKLRAVFTECHRVLKDDGLLVFSYHHSREDGWTSVAAAVLGAGFRFVQAQPVKAEMSVATPKLAAKSPIDLDVMLVCRKVAADQRRPIPQADVVPVVEALARDKVARFNGTRRKLSLNDVRVIVLSQALVECSAGRRPEEVVEFFDAALNDLAEVSVRLHEGQRLGDRMGTRSKSIAGPAQASLF